MILFPAIDIKGGKVVRLKQGRFDDVTVYSNDPLSVAKKWIALGAKWLHVVDLDGAQHGAMANLDVIRHIAESSGVPIQVGGGIRNQNDIEELLRAGVSRVILATRVIEDQTFLKSALDRWAEKIAVSVDCANGMVTQRGWTKVTEIPGVAFAKTLESEGLRYLIYTDVACDGMLKGPNLPGLKEILNAVTLSVIASGGISDISDIQNLLAFRKKNLIGAITGKAIYEGTLDLKEALKLCSQNE